MSNVSAGCESASGWLLDVYEDPLGGVVVWFLGDDGRRRRLRQRFAVTFYAYGAGQLLAALEARLRAISAPVRLYWDLQQDVFARQSVFDPASVIEAPAAGFLDFIKTPVLASACAADTARLAEQAAGTTTGFSAGCAVPVLAVEVTRPVDLLPLFRQVSREFPGLNFANADLALSLRYAAATGVSPLCRCQLQIDASDTIQAVELLEGPWVLDPQPIPLRVLALAPDCNPAHSVPRWLRVRCQGRAFRLALEPVRPLLVNLRALLTSYDPDLLLTAWGDTWLLPHLLEMAEAYHLPLPLNRDPQAELSRRKERWYFSYGQVVYRGEQVLLKGRFHLDSHNAMLWSDYDLDGVLEMTRVTGLPLQTAARVSPGTGISSIQMLTALRARILVPWQKQQAEMPRPALDLFTADQGGLVYQPRVGVHRNVAEVDFVSMYPAIMVNFNISPETLGAFGSQTERVPELGLVIDRSQKGLVPRALAPLLQKRIQLKNRMSGSSRQASDKRRASALKWLLVTCFGYLGYKNARFGRIEAHQAVTAYGRETLLRAKEAAEDLGMQVLHLYVDGMWVTAEGKSQPADFQPLLDDIAERAGLPIALDGVYRWVVFVSSRQNANRPVANRYFGVFQSGEIKVRGIAARRRDTPDFIAKVQMELLEVLARANRPEDGLPDARRCLSTRLAELAGGRVALTRLLFSQRITRDLDAYRSPSPAARAALQLQADGKIIKPGQSVRFLYTLGRPGVWAWDRLGRFEPKSIDLPRYRTLLLRAAEEVLAPFSANSLQ
jgi:DNA polymerase II